MLHTVPLSSRFAYWASCLNGEDCLYSKVQRASGTDPCQHAPMLLTHWMEAHAASAAGTYTITNVNYRQNRTPAGWQFAKLDKTVLTRDGKPREFTRDEALAFFSRAEHTREAGYGYETLPTPFARKSPALT